MGKALERLKAAHKLEAEATKEASKDKTLETAIKASQAQEDKTEAAAKSAISETKAEGD